jgi:hypothetical protein
MALLRSSRVHQGWEKTSQKILKYLAILDGLITGGVENSFVRLLVHDILFVEYIKLSMSTAREGWLVRFCNLSEVDRSLFNSACQKILSYLYAHFEETLGKADKNMEASFQFQVFRLQTSDLFTKVIYGMPQGVEDPIANCLLLGYLKTMFMGWYHEELEAKCGTASALKKFLVPQHPVPAQDNALSESRKSDVTRVFGWAVKDIYSKWQIIRAQKKANHMRHHEIAEEGMPFIAQMRYKHSQAILDTEYMTNQYSTANQLRNTGGLPRSVKA